MMTAISPDPKLRKLIENAAHADSTLCWSCSSCDLECPVNIATSRLRPQKIVRMANLGCLDELLSLPEIWYCLTCGHCNNVCPNLVRPAALISYSRENAILRHKVSQEAILRYKDLFSRFQRVRWHTAARCLRGEVGVISERQWYDWLETPVEKSGEKISDRNLFSGSEAFRNAVGYSGTASCFTCGECGSACPVMCEQSVFDPRVIFRMVNLGLAEELLKSPSIWLCIGCERCTLACSQLVKGDVIIRHLQEMALNEGFADSDFPFRWYEAHKAIYPRLLEEIDKVFGFSSGS